MFYSNRIECPAKDFAEICKQVGYRKRTLNVEAKSQVTLMDLNWSGGTRYVYSIVDLSTMQVVKNTLDYSKLAPWRNPAEGATVPIPPGFAVFQHGDFCGKPSSGTIYIHPDNMPALIAA